MDQQSKIVQDLKPTETRTAFVFNVIGALGGALAAAATIWVGISASRISDQQTKILELQKSVDLAASLAELIAEPKDVRKHVLALRMLTAYSQMKYGALPNELLGVALVDDGSETEDRTPIESELQRMTCVLPRPFDELAKQSYDLGIRQRAQQILDDARNTYDCQDKVAVAHVGASPQSGPPVITSNVSPAPTVPANSQIAPSEPVVTTTNKYSVIIASEPNKKAAQDKLLRIKERLANGASSLKVCIRPPTREPCWWSIDVGSGIPYGDAGNNLKAARLIGFTDAYITKSRSEQEGRAACGSDWADLPSNPTDRCAD